MSPFKIDGLGALEFHDDDFRYRGKSVSFGAIRSIQFTASQTRHSVNFIPIGSTFSSSLCLILDQGNKVNIRQEYGYRAKTQKSNMDAVCRAAEILSQVTFNQRVERYERELADKGFFKCGQYQIAKDGGLFVNWSRVFGIHDRDVTISLHPFHLHIHRPRVGVRRFFFGPEQHVLPIDCDRDCILYILKHNLRIAFAHAPTREKNVNRRHLFSLAILKLGAKLAKADGAVSREEIAAFKEAFKVNTSTMPNAAEIFEAAIRSTESVENIATDIVTSIGKNQEFLEYVVLGLLQVAAADGKFHEAELLLIRRTCAVFGFADARTSQLFAIAGAAAKSSSKSQSGDKNHQNRKAPAGNSVAIIYLRILGLKEGASQEEIKSAYRQLARKHHPDHLRASGIPIAAIRQSEDVLKVVNEAYSYLSRA